MKLQYIRTSIVTCLLFLCTLFLAKSYAQQKRMLTPQDYKLWDSSAQIGETEVSNDGKWLNYRIINKTGKDTVYLKNTGTGLQYSFSISPLNKRNTYFGENSILHFSTDSKWFALRQGDSSILMNLSSAKTDLLIGLSDFNFTAEGRYLLAFKKDSLGNSLLLKDLKTLLITTINHVKEYSLNFDKSILAIIIEEAGKTKVKTISLKSGLPFKELAFGEKQFFKSLKWNKPGTDLTFLEMSDGAKKNSYIQNVYLCTNLINNPLIRIFNPKDQQGLGKFDNAVLSEIYLSDDGKQLFFNLHQINTMESDAVVKKGSIQSDVQIWSSSDNTVPPSKYKLPANWQCFVWWVETGKLTEVTDAEHHYYNLTGDQKKALVYNKNGYLPQYKYVNVFMDIYIRDLITGDKKLMLKKVQDQPNAMLTSPTGKYVSYFKDKNWWVYDIYNDTHKCITSDLNVTFENIELESTGSVPPFGNPGWLEADSWIILYDQFDIWLMSPDGTQRKKLTNGRKSKTSFRIYNYGLNLDGFFNGDPWFNSNAYSENEVILVTSVNNDNLDNGLWFWNKKFGVTKILEKGMKLSHSSKPGYLKPLLFTESTFDISPRLMLLQPSGKEELLYQSNPQQQEFYWGKSELIHYTADGKDLKGALIYPANYDPNKKYPMVVEIYEMGRSKGIHNYIEPSEGVDKSYDILNPTTFTSEGYFVLFPDIAYEVNNPGISASHCVVAAVKKVIEKGLVEKEKIGLIGHSFGGYETAFIISQTNIFKTAVAGAAFTDLPDWYLEISGFGVNMERVEADQCRMTTPFYGEDFRHNSPMDNIETINTPLLLWTGDNDTNVDWKQSRKFQIALWRLGKKSSLLVYPGENHSLTNDVNVKDLGVRIKNWFDYYLKDKKPAQWILGNNKN